MEEYKNGSSILSVQTWRRLFASFFPSVSFARSLFPSLTPPLSLPVSLSLPHWKHTKIIISAAICEPRNNNGKSLTYATFILSPSIPLLPFPFAALQAFADLYNTASPPSPSTIKCCSQQQLRQRQRQRQRNADDFRCCLLLLLLLLVVTSICCKAHKKHKRVNKVNLIYFEYKLHFLRLPTAAANSSSSSSSRAATAAAPAPTAASLPVKALCNSRCHRRRRCCRRLCHCHLRSLIFLLAANEA